MFKKVQKAASNLKLKKKLAVLACALIICTMMVPLVGAETVSEVAVNSPAEAGSALFDMLSEQINLTTIVTIIGISLGSCLGIYLGMFAIRKVGSALKGALHNKLKIG